MRVLHVSQGASDGGAERVIRDIIRSTLPLGVKSQVAAPAGPFDFSVPRYELRPLQRKFTKLPPAVRSVWTAIEAASPDLIHFHTIGYFLAHRLSLRYRSIPVVLGLHGLPEQTYPKVAGLLRRLSRCTLAYGPGTSRILTQYSIKHRLIFCGISAAPEPATKEELAEQIGCSPDMPIVFAMGRLVDLKNHITVLRALPMLPGVRFVIAGEGAARDMLEAEARALNVVERFTLLGQRNDARRLVAAADVAVMPSTSEGFGLAAAEAMLAGCPLAAADSPGLREWITHEERGLLVPPRDPAAWAAAIRRLLDDRMLATKVIAGATAFASQLTLDQMAADHVAVYQQL